MAMSRITTAMDDAYVRCRSYGHAWDEFVPIDLDPPVYGWRLSLRCIRCTMERHDNLAFSGALMARRYIPPTGYSSGRGEEKPTRTEFRQALFDKLRAKLEKSNSIGEQEPAPKKRTRKAAVSA